MWVDFNAVFNKEAAVFLFSILLEMVFTLALNVFGNPVVLGRAHGKERVPRLPCKPCVAGMLVLDPRRGMRFNALDNIRYGARNGKITQDVDMVFYPPITMDFPPNRINSPIKKSWTSGKSEVLKHTFFT